MVAEVDRFEDAQDYDNDTMITRLDEQYQDDLDNHVIDNDDNAEVIVVENGNKEDEQEENEDDMSMDEDDEDWENIFADEDLMGIDDDVSFDEGGYFYDNPDEVTSSNQDIEFETRMMEPQSENIDWMNSRI